MKKRFIADLAIEKPCEKKDDATEYVINQHQFDKLVICPNSRYLNNI